MPAIDEEDKDGISMLHHLSADANAASAASESKKLPTEEVEIPSGGSQTLRCIDNANVWLHFSFVRALSDIVY